MSSIAWLDTSPEEQRKTREMLSLFSQKQSLDELGIGPIRDALSDTLFPGTSTLHTRARYFLLIPWCYLKAAEGKHHSPEELHALAQNHERTLAAHLKRDHPDEDGIIGRRAGHTVRVLPSAMFWRALVRWGILLRDVDPRRLRSTGPVPLTDGEGPVRRSPSDWHPTLPPRPVDLPWQLPGGLSLTHAEAAWLQERIIATTDGTLLATLAQDPDPLDDASPMPWRDSKVDRHAAGFAELDHARRFSKLIAGATRLYNVLTARAYLAAGFNRACESIDGYEQKYRDWLTDLGSPSELFEEWNLEDFWELVRRANPRVAPRTERFVRDWARLVAGGQAHLALDHGSRAAQLIAYREKSVKRGQARLANEKLLGIWGGESMPADLSFRWPQVRQVLTDIQQSITASDGAHAGA
ncbi:DUF6361 family protein [Enemella sp. A6]|uniref:DUF6361 family protein n=1 Tax=Enemella sp. A6 TaxID=3440152 RepID=UPI003EBBD880